MSERLEYSGDPLPSGLPGFGGGTITVLPLPGFSRVVAAQKFGPVNDAPTVTPPDPTPPPGSNPEDPVPPGEVVPPAPAPPASSNSSVPIFCKECVDQGNVGDSPLMYGVRDSDSCVGCDGKEKTVNRYFSKLTASSPNAGIFWTDSAELTGKFDGDQWKINNLKLSIDTGGAIADLLPDQLSFRNFGEVTTYATGPRIVGEDDKVYEPQDLEVCVNGSTETWKVLAYKQP